jgi:hypothetical protein
MSAGKLLTSQTACGAVVATPGGAAGVTPAAAPASGAFDAILMLEELAASAVAGIEAGAAELDAADADAPTEDTEDSVEGGDDPLAFLAALIAVSPQGNRHIAPHAAGVSTGTGGEMPAAGGAIDAAGTLDLFDNATVGGAAADSQSDAAAAARALAQAQLFAGDARSAEETPPASRTFEMFSQAPRSVAASAVDHAPIATHVRDPRWAEEFGTRIALLVNQRESVASLSLTPVDLGPVDVSVTVRDSQATIHFGAAQAETRALLEASLPKLRELLAAQGFQLLDASVSQGFTRQSRADAPSVPRPSHAEEVTAEAAASLRLNGLLDTYA